MPRSFRSVTGSRVFCALLGLALAGLGSAVGYQSVQAQDTAQDVIGRNKLITNPQIRRDLHFQRSPGLRARSFKDSGGFVDRGPRPEVGRLRDVPRGALDRGPATRQRGTDDPALPGVEPTPEEQAARRGVFKGVEFPRPAARGWLERSSKPAAVE